MELHFIILTALCSILLLFIILAVCAFCCGDLCCNCGSSSYSHSRNSFQNENFTTSSKTSAKGEYHSETYSKNGQIMSLSHDFEVDENQSASVPLLVKDPPKRIGFEYLDKMPQEEIRETPYPNGSFYPPSETVAIVSYPASQRTSQQQDPNMAQTSHRVKTVSYTSSPDIEANGISHSEVINDNQFANTSPSPNQNTSLAPARITMLEKIPNQSDPVKTETVRHVKTVSYVPYQPSRQVYSSDMETNEMSHHHSLPNKNSSRTETHVSRMVTSPSSQRVPYQQDADITETSYHVERGSFAPHPQYKKIYAPNTETIEVPHAEASFDGYTPIKSRHYASDAAPIEAAYFTRSGSCPPSECEATTRNYYSTEPRRNKTHSVRTATYSSENIPYPISIRVANSVELLPSSDSEVPHGQTQVGRSPLRKQPSQVSLYDNM